VCVCVCVSVCVCVCVHMHIYSYIFTHIDGRMPIPKKVPRKKKKMPRHDITVQSHIYSIISSTRTHIYSGTPPREVRKKDAEADTYTASSMQTHI
jgi:hypothetical protein